MLNRFRSAASFSHSRRASWSIAAFFILAALAFISSPASANAYRTEAIDATNNFLPEEGFPVSSGADTAYITWDASYIYIGISGADADFNNCATHIFFGTSNAAGQPLSGNGSTDGYAWGNNVVLPFKADTVVVWKNDNTPAHWIDVQYWTGAAWALYGNAAATALNVNEINFSVAAEPGGNFREVRISRSRILGNTDTIFVCVFVEQQWGGLWRYMAVPGDAWTDGNRGAGQTFKKSFLSFLLYDNRRPIGFDSDIIVTEVQPSASANDEWIEIYNRGDGTRNLAGWYVADGAAEDVLTADVGYGRLLGPRMYAVIVDSDIVASYRWATNGPLMHAGTTLGDGLTDGTTGINVSDTVEIRRGSGAANMIDYRNYRGFTAATRQSEEKIIYLPSNGMDTDNGNWNYHPGSESTPFAVNRSRMTVPGIQAPASVATDDTFQLRIWGQGGSGDTLTYFNTNMQITIDAGSITPSYTFRTFTNGDTRCSTVISGTSGLRTITVRSVLDSSIVATTTVNVLNSDTPTFIINTVDSRYYAATPLLNVDFADNQNLDTCFYQVDTWGGTWKTLTTDGSTTTATSIAGNSYTADFYMQTADWTALGDGSHVIYFRAIDDNGKETGATAASAKGLVIIKDITAPVITVNRDSYTLKGLTAAFYEPGFFDIDFSDATGAVDTAYVWRGGDTQVITSYAQPSYTTNWNLNSSLFNNLNNPGINAVIVEAVDSAGNRARRTIYVAREMITINGDSAADWQNDEVVSSRVSGVTRITWDDTSFYFSFGGIDGDLAGNDWFVYFQTSSVTNADSSYTTHNWAGLGTHKLPFGANYMIGIEDGNIANSEFRSNTGGAWNASSPDSSAEVYGGWSGVPTTEYRVGWNKFGGKPAWMKVVAFPQWNAAATMGWGAAPGTVQEGAASPATILDYFNYAVMADTVPPDTQRVSFALKVSPTTVNVGATFTLTVSAVNARGETLVGINSPVTLAVSGGGTLGITTCTFVNGIATISESITNAAGNVIVSCTALYNPYSVGGIFASTPIFVQANTVYGWHAAALNRPDTGAADADSFMRTVSRDGVDTMWPRWRTTDNPVTIWCAKDSANVDTVTNVTMWYAVRTSGWSSLTPSETRIASDSITYYRFSLSQAAAAGWDYYETVGYYFRLIQPGRETTYLYGNGVVDDITESTQNLGEALARVNSFLYRIKSTAPQAVAAAISPTDGQTNVISRRPTLTWRAADDVDTPTGDAIANYYLEISRTGTWSDTTSFSLDVGWLGSSATSHACTTTLDPYIWYYWRVKAKDSNGFDSPWSDTFQFQINAIIAVDGQLSDWVPATEKFPTLNANGYYLTWDSNFLYVAWDRGSTFETTDVCFVYIDTAAGGTTDAINWNGGGVHTLPFAADIEFNYRHREYANGFDYQVWNGAGWTWKDTVTGGSEYKNGTTNLFEFSIPWLLIGPATTDFNIMMYVENEYNSNWMFSSCPATNPQGAAPQNFSAYLRFSRAMGAASNDRYYYRSIRTWQAAGPSTASFSPIVDGVKDVAWGNTPAATSSSYRLPAPGAGDSTQAIVPAGGLCRDVYVTNDAQWLYIGWQAFGDPFNLDEPGQTEQSANYGFAITDTSSYGSPYDPWKSAGTTFVSGYGANVWVNLFANFGGKSFSDCNRYTTLGGAWDVSATMVPNQDFAGYLTDMSAGWGEVRIPLSSISPVLKPGDSIAIIHFSRHNASKPGADDATPFISSATSDWAISNAHLQFRDTAVLVYAIKQGVIDAYHVPDTIPVTGLRMMRYPDTALAGTSVNMLLRAKPTGVISSARVYYSSDSGGNWNYVSLTEEISSGEASYWSGFLPTFVKDSIVLYYFQANSDRMTTYVYGAETWSTATASQAIAIANPFRFTISNTAPTAPTSITISPYVPANADTITATASGSSDSDATDSGIYRFEWRKNGVSTFVTYDAIAPYTSSVSPESTLSGESWQVFVSTGDGTETSATTAGPAAVVATLVEWPGTAATEANRARVVTTGAVTEWIWTDKTGEVRFNRDYLDIRELRLQTDTNNFYVLMRLGSFLIGNPHIVIAIDSTLDGAGGIEIGDQTNTLLDSGVTSPKARHERQIAIHSVTPGSMVIEIDTGGGGANWITPPSGYSLTVTPTAGVIEARVSRTDLGLLGPKTIRVAVAAFDNIIGSAALINSTWDESGFDVIDAISMAAVGLNDTGRILSGVTEDFSDGDLDYSAQLLLSDTRIVPNTQPGATPMQLPATGETAASNPPTFTWGIPADTDVADTVIAYLFELADSGTSLDGSVLFRVISLNQYYQPPTLITDSQYYTWRVRGIDRAGNVGSAASQTFFLRNQTSILVNAPTDLQNVNNMRQMNGDDVAGTSIRWNWVAAVHSDSSPIAAYVIQIDTSTNFTSPIDSITLPNAARIYTWTSAQPGNTYYARILAVDTGGFRDTSPASNGIYVSRRNVNGDSSDWAPSGGLIDSTANLNTTFAEGIWKDATGDQRADVANSTSRDILQFHVTADLYNIYFLIPTVAFVDGQTIGQIAVSYDASSDARVYEGTGVRAEDSFTAMEAAWERMVKYRTGNDDVTVMNSTFAGQPGRYTENTGQKYVEICVPFTTVGGSSKVLGKTLKFSFATFYNNNGAIGQNGANNSNIVDAVTNAATTWTDVNDQVLNYYLNATFDTGGRVTAFSGVPAVSTAPPQPNQDYAPNASNRDLILYNIFVDRFVNGRSDNQPGDPNMMGGDFKGLRDSMQYLNEMGVNGLYLGPIAEFGGGTWGYGQSDLMKLQWSFQGPGSLHNGWSEFVSLVKQARYQNINTVIDWIPGQIGGNATVAKRPEIRVPPPASRFGGARVREEGAEARQFFADHSMMMISMGTRGLRADNTKFYEPNDDPSNGLPFYRYQRLKWNDYYPSIYVFGEQPGNAGQIGMYTRDGARMSGQLDFEWRKSQMHDFCREVISSTDLRSRIEAAEAEYNGTVEACMASMVENHDHHRTYHWMGDHDANGNPINSYNNDGSKQTWIMDRIRLAHLLTSLHAQVPVILYGDEVPISGFREKAYPLGWDWGSTPGTGPGGGDQSLYGNTRPMPWNWPDGTYLRDAFRTYYQARSIFSEIRGARNAGRAFAQPNANVLVYRRGEGNGDLHQFVGVANQSAATSWCDIPTGNVGTFYRDWINSGAAGTSDGSGNLVNWGVPGRDGFILVRGGYGRRTVHVSTGVAGAIVSIDKNCAWTRVTGADGTADIPRVVGWEGGVGYDRTLYAWKKGYTVHTKLITLPAGPGDQATQNETLNLVTLDITAPAAPTGLSVIARDRSAVLKWSPISDWGADPSDDIGSYRIYRSTNPNDANPTWINETMEPFYYDSDFDEFLTNGDTYYYKVRAVDRNDNQSGFSNEVAVVPTKFTVKFYFELEDSGMPGVTVTSVKISGNHGTLGWWAPIAMTQLDATLWYFEAAIDPTTMIEWKYLINDGWEAEGVFYSNNVSYERHGRPRLRTIADHTGNGVCIFTNRWQYDGGSPSGDIAPRRVKNVLATGGDTFLSIGWTPNPEPDVSRYIIRRSLDQAAWTEIGDAAISQNTFTDTAVVPATTYYYQVRAVDWWNQGGNWSATTSAQLVSSDVTAPAKPSGLTLQPVDTGSIYITWSPNSDGDMAGYYLYRSTDPNVPVTLGNRVSPSIIGASISPTHTDTGVTNGIRYYYKLVAVDYAGNASTPSDTVSAYIVALTLSCDLANITGAMEVSGNVRSLGPSPARVTLPVYSGTVRRKTYGVLAGQALQFIYSFNSGATVERAFTTGSQKREYTPPEIAAVELNHDWEDAPEGVGNPLGYAGNQVAYLQWTADSSVDVVGHYIERAGSTDTVYTRITPSLVTGTSYTDSGLVNNETYYYLVRSVDGGSIQLQSPVTRAIEVTPRAPVWIRFRVDAAPPERRLDLARRRR